MIHLLIVDDEPLLLDIAKTYLEKTGDFTVDTAESAREALEMMQTATYDAIVSDYEMPDMDGIGFLKTIRGSGSDIPFIIFTGRGREDVVIEALNEGADFYLQKGGQPKAQFAELSHKIQHAVRERKSEHELSKAYRQFQNIIEFLPDASFVIDRDGQVIAWNKAMEEMTGVLKEDIVGKGDYAYAKAFYGERRPMLVDIIPARDEATESRYDLVKRDGENICGEVYLPLIYGGRGGYIWAKASLLYDAEGHVTGAIESVRDISERKKAELDLLEGFDKLNAAQDDLAAQNRELEESEERYRNVVEGQTEFISRFLPDGTHIFVNEAYCRYFGKRREEIMRHRFVPAIPSEDQELVKNHFASLTPDHPVDTIEHRIIMPDGEVRWQRWSDRAIFDENGMVIEYQSVGRDITEIKCAEESLRQSEIFYRTLFESTGAPTVIIGEDTTILWANSAYENLSGYSKKEVAGKKTWTEFVVKEDLDRMREYHRLRRSDSGTAPRNYEFRFIDRSGDLHDIYLTIQMIPDTKKSVASLLDITDRKQAEIALYEEREQLAVTLRSIGDGVIVTDTDGNVTLLNKVAEDLTGWNEQEASGRPLSEVFHIINEKTREICENPVKKVLESGFVIGLANHTALIARDGTERSIADSGAPIRDKENKILGVVLVFRDVTEKRQAEEALHESEIKLRTIWETVQGGIVVIDAKTHTIDFINTAAVDLIGVPKEEIIGNICHKFICPAVEGRCPITDLGQKVDHSERVLLNSRGESIPILKSVTKMTIGGHDYLVENFIDITDRKAAEEALRESEEEFRALAENSQDYIMRYDLDHRHTYGNPACLQVSGKTRDEFLGKTHREMGFPPYLCDLWESALDKVFETGQPYSEIFAWTGVDGEVVLDWRLFPEKDTGGRVTSVLGVSRDVTDQKAAEARIDHLNSVLLAIRDLNQLITHETDLSRLILQACEILAGTGAYHNPWLALFDESGHVSAVAESGLGEDVFQQMRERLDTGDLPACVRSALAEEGVVVTEDPASDCPDCPLSATCSADRAVMSTRLESGGKVYGVISLTVPGAFVNVEDEQALFMEAAADLAFALHAIEMEEERAAAHRKMSDIIDFLPDATLVIDSDGRVIAWNLAMEVMTGISKEDMLGKGDYEYGVPFYGKPRPILIDLVLTENPDIESQYDTVKVNGVIRHSEIYSPHVFGGRGAYLSGTASALYDSRGNIAGAIESIRDITNKKQAEEVLRESEERYRNVVEDQTEFVCRFLPDGTHVFANKAYCQYFGKKQEEIIGQKFVPEIPDEDQELVKNFFRSLTPDHPVASIRHRIIMLDGDVRWQRWNDRAIFDENNEIIEFQSVGRDITDVIRAESALEVANKKLQLLTGITRHDIINQITALAGYTDLLGDVLPDDPEMRKYIDRITKATSVIEEQIRFTADYEELGMQPSRWQRVGDVAERAAPGGTGIHVSTATGTLEIFTDPMLEKVFFNLFENAVRHGGYVMETITVTCREEDGGNMVIAVEDDGVGVPADMKERIFKRGVGSNTGYGLFLVQEILGITGMSIRETGEEGKGARFEITVPPGVWRLDSEGM